MKPWPQALLCLHLARCSRAVGAACTAEMLQRDAKGNYYRIADDSANRTSCAHLTAGRCPIAVPIQSSSCLFSCVASEAECWQENPSTPGIDSFKNPDLCTSCDIAACQRCTFLRAGEARCDKCAPGFQLENNNCIIWGQKPIVLFTNVLLYLVTFCVVLVLLGTLLGSCHVKRRWTQWRRSCASTGATPLLKTNGALVQASRLSQNKEAIGHGLTTSLHASIKISYFVKNNDNSPSARKVLNLIMEDADLGIGLKLFFNTQLFLISFSFMLWAMVELAYVYRNGADDISVEQFNQQCLVAQASFDGVELQIIEMNRSFAETMRISLPIVWVFSLAMSWAFHILQKKAMRKYDQQHNTAEDYTLLLTNVPSHVTSERFLKKKLEEELNMVGKIHGVCICYNVRRLSEEEKENLKAMIENVVESDDLTNYWCPEHLSHPANELEEAMAEDAKGFKSLLQTKKLTGCGRCYVAFKRSSDMLKILRERKGISMDLFASEEVCEKDPLQMVEVLPCTHSPEGLRFGKMELSQEERATEWIWVNLQQLFYVLVYWVIAQMVQSYFIAPYKTIGVQREGSSASAAAVKIVSTTALLLNFAIQTKVMVDVEDCAFVRVSRVDKITFIWNTVLLIVTLGYTLVQECQVAGFRMNLIPSSTSTTEALWKWKHGELEATVSEIGIVRAILAVFIDQTVMLYILGEVGNVIAPLAINWFVLRAIFIQNIGGTHHSRVQQLLRGILPRIKREDVVTPREAERAQSLAPFALWMEYSYIVIFPFIACSGAFFIGPFRIVCKALAGFSIIFFLWQRYVMLWLYGKMAYDGADTYLAFIHMWGLVISVFPLGYAWWSYRLGAIQEFFFVILLMVVMYLLALMIYCGGILFIEDRFETQKKDVDDNLKEGADPGYAHVIDRTGISWWNVNPIYMLKKRYCPEDIPGFEVHDADVQCWPSWSATEGIFEPGKDFRHRKQTSRQDKWQW